MSCTRTFVAAQFTAAVPIASIPALAAEPPKPQSADDKASQKSFCRHPASLRRAAVVAVASFTSTTTCRAGWPRSSGSTRLDGLTQPHRHRSSHRGRIQ